jgi:tetratricopeptide (TPR) repeat protein
MARQLPVHEDDDPLFEAQDLMYDAFEAEGTRRVELALEALEISGDCADAYLLLAEEAAPDLQAACDLLEAGVAAGERAIGPGPFKHDVGNFWDVFETRPYMRGRAALAETLWQLKRHDEAVEHMYDLLRLNPNDDQGNREVLVEWLLYLGRYDELDKLLAASDADDAAVMVYTKALAAFCREGASAEANRLLAEARERNAHVPAYLTGRRRLPARRPDSYSIGGRSEALLYAADAKALWQHVPGALAWLE